MHFFCLNNVLIKFHICKRKKICSSRGKLFATAPLVFNNTWNNFRHWALLMPDFRQRSLCIFMMLISVAYGGIYASWLVQMAQPPIFSFISRKKGKSFKVKGLEANPFFWAFPSNSIKSGSCEHLFHLQGNMCQIEFSIVQNGFY